MILDILSICIHLGPLLQPLKGSKEAITLFFSHFQFLVCLLKTHAKIWKIESQSIVILVSHPLSDIFRDFGDFRDFLWSDLSTSTPWPLLNFDKIIDIPFLLAQNNIKFARKKGLSLNFAFLSKGPHPPYRLLLRNKHVSRASITTLVVSFVCLTICLSIYVTWSIHAETQSGRIVASSGLFSGSKLEPQSAEGYRRKRISPAKAEI